jgi:metal-dependent HD superfamily phosphatase/phosphodiesterase
VPARYNPRLQQLLLRIQADSEIHQWWRCANVNAMERLGLSDHGEIHARVVANAALRILRLLRDAGRIPNLVSQYQLTYEDAEVVVVLSAALHDIGLAIQADRPPDLAMVLAYPKAQELLDTLYPPPEQVILTSEVVHAIALHHSLRTCLTLEAGVLRLADALDIAGGRIRHIQPSTQAAWLAGNNGVIQEVLIKRGVVHPIRVELMVNRPVAVKLIEETLNQRLQQSPLFGEVEIDISAERIAVPLYANTPA